MTGQKVALGLLGAQAHSPRVQTQEALAPRSPALSYLRARPEPRVPSLTPAPGPASPLSWGCCPCTRFRSCTCGHEVRQPGIPFSAEAGCKGQAAPPGDGPTEHGRAEAPESKGTVTQRPGPTARGNMATPTGLSCRSVTEHRSLSTAPLEPQVRDRGFPTRTSAWSLGRVSHVEPRGL